MSPPQDPGFVLWLTGLPGSGKTTLAVELRDRLAARQIRTVLLDSDQLRTILTPEPTYSEEERQDFYRVVVELAGMLADQGAGVIVAATAPRRRFREAARTRTAAFAEIFVDCPEAVCRQRDPKGLWERADRGEITRLPGAGAVYEPPVDPEVRVNTAELSPNRAVAEVLRQLDEASFFEPAQAAV